MPGRSYRYTESGLTIVGNRGHLVQLTLSSWLSFVRADRGEAKCTDDSLEPDLASGLYQSSVSICLVHPQVAQAERQDRTYSQDPECKQHVREINVPQSLCVTC